MSVLTTPGKGDRLDLRRMKIYRPEEVTPEILASVRADQLSPEQLRDAYALAREAFTVEDLLRFTENVEDVSAEEVLRELEETQKHFDNRETQ